MLWLKIAALILAGTSNILMGTLVFIRSTQRLNNYSFFALIFSMGGWALAISGFYLSHTSSTALIWAKIYYLFPLIIALALVVFVDSFPDRQTVRRSWLLPTTVGFLLLALPLIISREFLTQQIIFHDGGKEVVLNRYDYLLYSTYILVAYLASLLRMFAYSQKKIRLYSAQARMFSVGFFVALVFGVFFNLILPWFGNYRYIWVGPLFTSAFFVAIAYSIVRHRMFDIRLVIARSATYVASLAVLATLYGLIVFSIAKYAFGLHLSLLTQIYLSLATGTAGLLFQRPIRIFDKLTNSVFYRDAYDAQELFDNLNRLLVSSLDLNYLLKHSSVLLRDSLKADYVLIGLKSDQNDKYRVTGTSRSDFASEDIELARKLTPKHHYSVIVADYLDEKYAALKELMNQNNISVLVRLVPDVHKGDEGLGYIVLGAKKSGNPYSNQDVRVLDTVANELIIAIQNALHFEEIQKFNATLQARVEEATRQLRRTNSKLEALDETKDDFISMASHQLRTPLTSVKGYLSMVLEGDAGKINDTQRKMLGQAFISSQRMVYLIADLLNVSRLKTGKFVIDRSPVDLSKVIQEEISQLVETAEARGIKLTYKKPASFPVLNMDETKTRQVIMNFVDNAIYYTPAGGKIDVRLEDKGQSIELRIVDNGIGVPKAEQHHLFTKFYRARNAQKARPDGTGLGLFMAKKVIVAQGGAILFESQEGQGSTFGFSFSKASLNPANSLQGAPLPEVAQPLEPATKA